MGAVQRKLKKKKSLPGFFKPILWSYIFEKIDPETDKKLIVLSSINYGDLKHWRWLVRNYGREKIRDIIEQLPASSIRERARRLAGIVFNIRNFNYASRGTQRKK